MPRRPSEALPLVYPCLDQQCDEGGAVIVCKRVYQSATADDGYRVLVDRLWPRGCSKASLPLDEWLRELAPSDGVRRAFAHEPGRFAEFRAAYRAELAAQPALWQPLLERAARGTLTLLYAAYDEQFNNARVLAEFLGEQLATRAPAGAGHGEVR